jgi:hypothetical protein
LKRFSSAVGLDDQIFVDEVFLDKKNVYHDELIPTSSVKMDFE